MTALAALTGMDRSTGRVIRGLAHVRQSVIDILTTATGTRVCNRDYGSDWPNIVDGPGNPETVQRLYAATALAVTRFYPQLTLTRIVIDPEASASGSITVTLTGHETGRDPNVTLTAALTLF